jgi:hypothetical protein
MSTLAQSEASWMRFMTSGKQELHRNNVVAATRMFQRAETEARAFGAEDLRRLLAMSWAAVGYYKMANFQLAESIFKQVFECYERCLPCCYTEEISNNLLYFALMYQSQGRKAQARIYFSALGPNAEERAQYLCVPEEARRSIVSGTRVSPKKAEERLVEVRALRQIITAAAEAQTRSAKKSTVAKKSQLPQNKEEQVGADKNNNKAGNQQPRSFGNTKWLPSW